MRHFILRMLCGVSALLFFGMVPVIFMCASDWQKLGLIPVAYFGWKFAWYAIKGGSSPR